METTASDISEKQSRPGPIVVEVDDSPSSRLAPEWAVREAGAHGNRVLALSAYVFPALAAGTPGFSFAPAERQGLVDSCRNVLPTEIAEAFKGHPSVQIEGKVFQGPAAQVLIDASRPAEALVVGSRGHRGFVGLLLGSVSQQCVIHGDCPVVVCMPRQDPPGVAAAQSGHPDSTSRTYVTAMSVAALAFRAGDDVEYSAGPPPGAGVGGLVLPHK
jgi:nucleotide-binding universal stress UspA family protein